MVTDGGLVVVGDCLLDVTVQPNAPATPGGDVPARVEVAPGGQGANVAVRLARLGVPVQLVTALGEDAAADLLRAALLREGVSLIGTVAGRTGAVLVLLDPAGERTMFSQRPPIASPDLPAILDGAGWVHVSGYVLGDDRSGDALADTLASLRGRARRSVGGAPGSASRGAPGSASRDAGVDVASDRRGEPAAFGDRLRRAAPELVLLSALEASQLLDGGQPAAQGDGGDHVPARLAERVAAMLDGPLVIVTGAAAGAAAARPGEAAVVVAAPALDVARDSTGAGDVFAATCIADLAPHDWPPTEDLLSRTLHDAAARGALATAVWGAQGRLPDEVEGA